MNKSRFNKIAEAAYDRVAARGDEFSLADVVAEIHAELAEETVTAELLTEFANSLANRVDNRRASSEAAQLSLLTDDEAMQQIWRLGDGVRVRAGAAVSEQALKHIGIVGENARRVVANYERKRKEIAELLVHADTPTTPMEKAKEAYWAARATTFEELKAAGIPRACLVQQVLCKLTDEEFWSEYVQQGMPPMLALTEELYARAEATVTEMGELDVVTASLAIAEKLRADGAL